MVLMMMIHIWCFDMAKNKLLDFNKEFAKVKKEHPRLPGYYARVVASDHVRLPKKKRD